MEVEPSHPIGLMVESDTDLYANQKWWQGFYLGWTCSCVIIGTCILFMKK